MSHSAWSPYCEKDKSLLERVHDRLTRMIPDFKQLPYIVATIDMDRKVWGGGLPCPFPSDREESGQRSRSIG